MKIKYTPYSLLHSKITVGTKLVYTSLETNKANYTYICDNVLKSELLAITPKVTFIQNLKSGHFEIG